MSEELSWIVVLLSEPFSLLKEDQTVATMINAAIAIVSSPTVRPLSFEFMIDS